MPGKGHCLRVIEQLGHDPGQGMETSEVPIVCQLPSPPTHGAWTGPSPQRRQQQGFVGPGGIQSPQQQEEGLGLLLEALEEGPQGTLRGPLTAQHTLQVQEEFCRWASNQGPDQQLGGPILALGTGGLQCCCPNTREEENTH